MRVRCIKNRNRGQRHSLSVRAWYEVIGIESGWYRIIDDTGEPYLFPPAVFKVVDPSRPASWVTTIEDGQEYSYPPEFNKPGFWEDYHDRKPQAVRIFARFLIEHLRATDAA